MSMTEQEIGEEVIKWLGGFPGYNVYQEVQCAGPIADIVVILPSRASWVIELKRSCGLSVIEQAIGWIGQANYVSVATPTPKRHQGFREKLLHDYGVGWLGVDEDSVTEISDAVFHRVNHRFQISKKVREEHKKYARAGSAKGGHWTPFKHTVYAVQQKVSECPGITVKDLVTGIRHHYASTATARTSIPAWIRDGVIDGVELRKEGRLLRCYPAAVE